MPMRSLDPLIVLGITVVCASAAAGNPHRLFQQGMLRKSESEPSSNGVSESAVHRAWGDDISRDGEMPNDENTDGWFDYNRQQNDDEFLSLPIDTTDINDDGVFPTEEEGDEVEGDVIVTDPDCVEVAVARAAPKVNRRHNLLRRHLESKAHKTKSGKAATSVTPPPPQVPESETGDTATSANTYEPKSDKDIQAPQLPPEAKSGKTSKVAKAAKSCKSGKSCEEVVKCTSPPSKEPDELSTPAPSQPPVTVSSSPPVAFPSTAPPAGAILPTLPPIIGTAPPTTAPPAGAILPTLPPIIGTAPPTTAPPAGAILPTLPPIIGTAPPTTAPPAGAILPTLPPIIGTAPPTTAPPAGAILPTLPPIIGTAPPTTAPPAGAILPTLPPIIGTAPPTTAPPAGAILPTLPPIIGTAPPTTAPPAGAILPTLPPIIGTAPPTTAPPAGTLPPIIGTAPPTTAPPAGAILPTLPPIIGTAPPTTIPPAGVTVPTQPPVVAIPTTAAPTLVPDLALYYRSFEQGDFPFIVEEEDPVMTTENAADATLVWALTEEKANLGVKSIKSPILENDGGIAGTAQITLNLPDYGSAGDLYFSLFAGTNMPIDSFETLVNGETRDVVLEAMTAFEQRVLNLGPGENVIQFIYKYNPTSIPVESLPPDGTYPNRIGTAFIDDVYYVPVDGVVRSSGTPPVTQVQEPCVPLDPNPDSFEVGRFPQQPWSTAGDGLWSLTHKKAFEGKKSLRSPLFEDGRAAAVSNATLQVCNDFPGGLLRLHVYASVLPPHDIFEVYIDGESAAQMVDVNEWTVLELGLEHGPHRVDFSYQYNMTNTVAGLSTPNPQNRESGVWIDSVEIVST